MADLRRYGKHTNATVYFEDNSLVGICPELELPDFEWKTVDIETLGQVMVLKRATRVMEAMTGSITLDFLEPELGEAFYNPTINHVLQLHEDIDIQGPDGFDKERSYKLITILNMQVFKAPSRTSKLAEGDGQKFEYSVSRLVQRVHDSDKVLLEADAFANTVRNSSGEFWSI